MFEGSGDCGKIRPELCLGGVLGQVWIGRLVFKCHRGAVDGCTWGAFNSISCFVRRIVFEMWCREVSTMLVVMIGRVMFDAFGGNRNSGRRYFHGQVVGWVVLVILHCDFSCAGFLRMVTWLFGDDVVDEQNFVFFFLW